ncbi:MAG: hypothetical protein C4330_04515 [Chitinophagaceae bacterium]
MKKVFVLITTLLVMLACTKNSAENITGNTSGCGNTLGPKFTAVRAVLQANCAISGCHLGTNAQNGINFSDNCTIVAQAARIKLRAVDQAGTSNQMPPPPLASLSSADQQKITDWINAGARITD